MSLFRSRPVRTLPLILMFGLGACGGEPDAATETASLDDAQSAVTAAHALTIASIAPARPVPTTDGKRHLV